jgi:hypothetical protein
MLQQTYMACNSHLSEFLNTYYGKQFTFLGVLALSYENDPIGYHLRHHEAAKRAQSLEGEAFSQICLDYLSALGMLALWEWAAMKY